MLHNLTREARIRTVSDVTNNACNDIEEIIYEALHAPKHSPIDMYGRLEVAINFLSGGKCHTVEEYIDEVLRLLKDNDLYDESIIARLEKTRQIYNNAITTRRISSVAELYQRLNNIRVQYFSTLNMLKSMKPDFSKYVKYKDIIGELVEFSGKQELMSFKEFYKTPMIQNRLRKYLRLRDVYQPEEIPSFEDFFAQAKAGLEAMDSFEPMYKDEAKAFYKDYCVTPITKRNQENRQKAYEDLDISVEKAIFKQV